MRATHITIHLRHLWTRAFFQPTSQPIGFTLQLKIFWSCDNIFAALQFARNLQIKFNTRKFNVSRQFGITWSAFWKRQKSKKNVFTWPEFLNCRMKPTVREVGWKKVLVHRCLRWIVVFVSVTGFCCPLLKYSKWEISQDGEGPLHCSGYLTGYLCLQ